MPDHPGILSRRAPGGSRTHYIFDSTGPSSALQNANFLHGVLMPEGADWGKIRASDEKISADREASLYLDFVSRKINSLINNSNFYPQSFATILDTVIGGTSLFLPRAKRAPRGAKGGTLDGMFFRSVPVANFWISENDYGEVDTIALLDERRAKDIRAEFGAEEEGRQVKHAIEQGKRPDQYFQVLQIVCSSEMALQLGAPPVPGGFEFVSLHFILGTTERLTGEPAGNEELIRSRGMRRFPGIAPRFAQMAGETYARGLGQYRSEERRVGKECRL